MLEKFWRWYEKNYTLNIGFTALLFLLQIFHLIWLFSEVITTKLFGAPMVVLHGLPKALVLIVDYTEIPALISASVVYLNELRKNFGVKSLLYLIFLNSQWLHLFWITDEFIVHSFFGAGIAPLWLAWIAILIDYLEVPVIVDTLKRFFISLRQQNLVIALEQIKEE